MHSGMIGKVEKAHRYVEERARFAFNRIEVVAQGTTASIQSAWMATGGRATATSSRTSAPARTRCHWS